MGHLARAVGIAALALAAVPATAQDRQVTGLAAADVFALADQARAAGRVEDATALYDALSDDPDDEVRAEARFRKGMMYADLRRYAEAAVAFRALLDEKPEAAAVRLELARMLAAMGREGEARRALRQAEAAGLPPEVSQTVAQFGRALRSSRSFGGSFEIGLSPDSNINRATDARTLDTVIAPLVLARDARARSGLGVRLAGQGFARLGLGHDLALLPRLAGTASLYRHGEFNDISGSALLGLEWRKGADRVSPSLGVTQRWYGGRPYARTYTVALDWLHPIGRRAQLVANASAARAEYLLNDLQNGEIYDLNLSFERALGARTGAGLTLSGSRQTARDPGYATWSGGATATVWHEAAGNTFFLTGGLRRTEGDARLFLFPERRREWLMHARMGGTLRRFAVAGFAPLLRVSYERNISTVGIYQYERVSTDIGVVRAF